MTSNPPGWTALPDSLKRANSTARSSESLSSMSRIGHGSDDRRQQQHRQRSIAPALTTAAPPPPLPAALHSTPSSSSTSVDQPNRHPIQNSHPPSLPCSSPSSTATYHVPSNLPDLSAADRHSTHNTGNSEDIEVIYTSGRGADLPSRSRPIALPNLDVSQSSTSYYNYSPGTSLIFNGNDRRINESLSPYRAEHRYSHLQANLKHMPRLPDRWTEAVTSARSEAWSSDSIERWPLQGYGSTFESDSVSTSWHQHDVPHSRASQPPGLHHRRQAAYFSTSGEMSEHYRTPRRDDPRHFGGYPQRPVRFLDDYYEHPLPPPLDPSSGMHERCRHDTYTETSKGPGTWHGHHSYLRSLDEPQEDTPLSEEDARYHHKYRNHHEELTLQHHRQYDAAEPSSAHGPEPDGPSAQRTASFSHYNTAHHLSFRAPFVPVARSETQVQQRRIHEHPRPQHQHQQRQQQHQILRGPAVSPTSLVRPVIGTGASAPTGQRTNPRDRPIYPSTLAPRPPTSVTTGQPRSLHPFSMSAEAARANSGAPNAQGNTDPVYELAPINYRMIYDYAFDIRECLVRGKPELLDKFLYSAEILCKVFNGCRVGCDFANAPQPAPAPQQLRCTSCNIVKTPEWRKGPLGPRTLCNACGLIWGKMSRDRATKAKAKAEAAAKAAVAVSSSSSSTTIASVSSQMPDGRRSQPTSDADTPPIFASPIVADTDVAAKPTAVTVMSSSKLVQPSPSTAMPLKRERQLSFDSGNECDREDGGDSDVARSPFRTQSPQRSAQKRRLVVRPQERMSILRMPFHRSLLPVGDADEDEDNMPLPDLVRVTKKPTSSSSVPVIDVMTADSTQVKEAPPLIGSKTNTEAVPPPNEVKNKPVMINPGINRVPAVPNLSFISRSVYSHQVLLSDSVGDTPIAADVIGGKSDTLVERLVLQSQDSQENAVYSDRIN